MKNTLIKQSLTALFGVGVLSLTNISALSAELAGTVQSANQPIAAATVTLYAAGTGAPQQLAQGKTSADGRFMLKTDGAQAKDTSLYLIARGGKSAADKSSGDNPAIALLSVVGGNPPSTVTINEMTTVASVWTNAQFFDGASIKGNPLGLKIAAGNVPNFVDLATGGWGDAIQGPLNGPQTPTMANFATLADVLAGCVNRVTADACPKLFAAATGPTGAAPTVTLVAAQSIARAPWYRPERLHALLDAFYPIPQGKNLRPVPYFPYLKWSPSAWVLPLKFDGGGYHAGGKAMFDSEGNLWVGDNFSVGWQGQDSLWEGHATKFAPNGKPLADDHRVYGRRDGRAPRCAIDAKDNAWFTTHGSKGSWCSTRTASRSRRRKALPSMAGSG